MATRPFTIFCVLLASSSAFAHASDPIPVPKAWDEPWHVAFVAESQDGRSFEQFVAHSTDAFTVTYHDTWEHFADTLSTQTWDAVIIDGNSVSQASPEDRQWMADAYWQRGMVIVGINMDRPTFRTLVGSCAQVGDKPVWWESGGPYFILSSRILHAVHEADRKRAIGELADCMKSENTEDPQGYVTESDFAAAYFLTRGEEFDFMYANLQFALEQVQRSRMNFARYLAADPELGTEAFVEILLSQGMTEAAIDELLEADGYGQ